MHDMTAANLRSAFGGESQAHMRYKIWADVAEKEGLCNVAALFRAVSFAEQIHATNHFTVLKSAPGAFLVDSMAGFGIGKTVDNLANALEGETFEINEMYPTYVQVAGFQDEVGAKRSLEWALATEKEHAQMFATARDAAAAGKDSTFKKIYVCKVCGYTHEGDAPEKCPICGAPKAKIEIFNC